MVVAFDNFTYTRLTGSSGPSATLPSGLLAGDQVVLLAHASASASLSSPPSGWVPLHGENYIASRPIYSYVRNWTPGDPTTINLTVTGGEQNLSVLAFRVRGAADHNQWNLGAIGYRADNGTPTTNVAPELETIGHGAVLIVSYETTLAEETSDPTLSSGTLLHHSSQTTMETVTVGSMPSSADTVGPVVITYENSQAVNGAAFLLEVPTEDAPVPLETPNVSVISYVDPVPGTPGTATVSWPQVSGASSYDAYMVTQEEEPVQTDFVVHQTDVNSPYTFTGLNAGRHWLGIQAKVL